MNSRILWVAAAAALCLLGPNGAPLASDGVGDRADAVRRNDNLPDPLTTKQLKLRKMALEARLAGKVEGKVVKIAKGQYVQLEREGEGAIWTVLGEFADLQHNMLPEPDRSVDNTTIWVPDFSTGRVKLAFTLENNNHGGRTPDGKARNANIGGINCVLFDEMALRLPLSLGRPTRVCVGGDARSRPIAATLEAKAEIYQDSSGGENWNRYQASQFHPRPNSYVSLKGYRTLLGGVEAAAGQRALGWLDVSDAGQGLTVGVEDFWQNYPKALAADQDGTVKIGHFPGRYAADFSLRSGEHKTHAILFFFHSGPTPDGGRSALARALSDPLRLEPSPQWFACRLSKRSTVLTLP